MHKLQAEKRIRKYASVWWGNLTPPQLGLNLSHPFRELVHTTHKQYEVGDNGYHVVEHRLLWRLTTIDVIREPKDGEKTDYYGKGEFGLEKYVKEARLPSELGLQYYSNGALNEEGL